MKPLRYHAKQTVFYRGGHRFPVVVAGRGSGKTLIAKLRTTRSLGERVPTTSTPMYFYGLPTTAQAKRVAWESLKAMLPNDWYRRGAKTFYESERIIKTRFNSELHVVGLDAPQRIEGNQWCGGVLDECSDQKPKVFDLTVRPALTDHKGWCARIGVPKRFGLGAADFKAAFESALENPDEDNIALFWESQDIVDPAELEKIKATTDSRDFDEQYRARWGSTSGAIFHAWHDNNIDPTIGWNPVRRLVVGSDFNVDPMCWCIGHRSPAGLEVFDELFIRNTNTKATLDELFKRYGLHKGGWEFFGDASSKARKTSASETDYIQIINDERFVDKRVYYLKKNPPIADRFAACNALICNANGDRRLKVHPRCTRLIMDLESRSYEPGSREPADSGDMGHMSDAFGYIVHRVWPLKISVSTKSPSGIISRNA